MQKKVLHLFLCHKLLLETDLLVYDYIHNAKYLDMKYSFRSIFYLMRGTKVSNVIMIFTFAYFLRFGL